MSRYFLIYGVRHNLIFQLMNTSRPKEGRHRHSERQTSAAVNSILNTREIELLQGLIGNKVYDVAAVFGPAISRLLERTLQQERVANVEQAQLKRSHCTCTAEDCEPHLIEPAYGAAHDLLEKAKEKAMEKTKSNQPSHEQAYDAKQTLPLHLIKFIPNVRDMMTLDLSAIWIEHLQGNEVHKRRQLRQLAERANTYCKVFFGKEHPLHPEVVKINDLDVLQNIVSTTSPISEDKYWLYRSAIAKINAMHLALIIHAQVDFDRLQAESQHLRKRLHPHCKKITKRRSLFHCGDGKNGKMIALLQVPSQKSEIAIALKLAEKDDLGRKDIDIGDIQDMLRCAVMLTKKDSKSVGSMEAAALEILAILIAKVGSDMSNKRLRYSFDRGVTNRNSTGQHRAVQLTWRHRSTCRSHERDDKNGHKVGVIPSEFQVRGYMSKTAREKDRKKYVAVKKDRIREMFGMNVTFTQFIVDVCDFILSDHDLPNIVKSDKTIQSPTKIRLAHTIFLILMEKDVNGVLVNEKIIKELRENRQQWGKIQAVIDKYKTGDDAMRNLRIVLEARSPEDPNRIIQASYRIHQGEIRELEAKNARDRRPVSEIRTSIRAQIEAVYAVAASSAKMAEDEVKSLAA